MTDTPGNQPDSLPTASPEAPGAAPPASRLQRLLRHKFLLVALAILLFFTFMFAWGGLRRHPAGPAPGHEPAPVHAPEKPAKAEEARKPAMPDTAKPAHEAPAAAAKPHGPAEPKPAAPAPHGPAVAKAPATGAAPEPKASPAVAPRREPVKGEVFTQALIKIMDDQLSRGFVGWRPNTILFGKMAITDDINNIQLGVLEVARRTVIVLNENMTRFATTEAYNPNVNEAMNFFMVSADKYWFPSASGKYREAVNDLGAYLQGLRTGRSRFYSRVDNLIALLVNYKDLLGSSFHNLIKDTEADGSSISWFKVDDYFYHSQGIALAMAEMLEAVKQEFHQELLKKNTHKLLDDAIHALHAGAHLSPWIITDGAKDGILANHRANLGTYIGEAEHVISTMQTVLATN